MTELHPNSPGASLNPTKHTIIVLLERTPFSFGAKAQDTPLFKLSVYRHNKEVRLPLPHPCPMDSHIVASFSFISCFLNKQVIALLGRATRSQHGVALFVLLRPLHENLTRPSGHALLSSIHVRTPANTILMRAKQQLFNLNPIVLSQSLATLNCPSNPKSVRARKMESNG